ncbi:MAG: hypothetical protein QOJ89_1953 [bacterium]|jgi:hypothetical protein
MRRPWESEEAAFAFLLRAVAVAAVFIVVVVALKAIF